MYTCLLPSISSDCPLITTLSVTCRSRYLAVCVTAPSCHSRKNRANALSVFVSPFARPSQPPVYRQAPRSQSDDVVAAAGACCKITNWFVNPLPRFYNDVTVIRCASNLKTIHRFVSNLFQLCSTM